MACSQSCCEDKFVAADHIPDSEPSSSATGVGTLGSFTESEVEELLSQYATTSTRFEVRFFHLTYFKVTNASDADFNENLGNAIRAIAAEVYPELILEGSSGGFL